MNLVDRRTYRGKHPKRTKNGFVNDRTIMYVDSQRHYVLYTNPVIERYQRKVVAWVSFERWASHDVTEQLPAGCYMTWEQYETQRLGIG